MGLLDFIFGKKDNLPKQELTVRNSSIAIRTTDDLYIHPDIKDLLWIADGVKKNYVNNKKADVYEFGGITITFSSMNQDEPSLIFTKLPLTNVNDISTVERPQYYPTYSQLTPEQKYAYWQLLANPYNPNVDIGFVFILYYGLERHLLSGNYEKAFEVIIKLRDVHNNKSFQSYSANAIILTCLCKQRADLAFDFINSLDKDYELHFSDNLFVMCKFSLDIPLTSKDIMRLAKSFEFNKLNYIKNNTDLFEEILSNNIFEQYKSNTLLIKDFITAVESKKLRKQTVSIFANVSIIDKSIDIPVFIDCFKFKKAIYDILDRTHEQVKIKVSELRKTGQLESKAENKAKPVIINTFDENAEKELIQALNKTKPNSLDRHFVLISMQDFYYKCRDIDNKYLNNCIEYCLIDINSLEEMQKSYYFDEVNRIKKLTGVYNKSEINNQISEVTAFIGTIPAFKRLAIIFEKQKDYLKAVETCEQALYYYKSVSMLSEVSDFEKRKNKLLAKLK